MKRIVTFARLDRGGVAIVSPFGQGHRGALGPGAQLIGPGPDRLRDIGGSALRLDDRAARLPQQERQVRLGIFQADHDRVGVGRIDLLEALEQALVLVGAGGDRVALERELHGCGVKRLAVVELDALAQLERIGLQIGRCSPALRQQGRGGAVLVDLGQGLIDVVERDLGDRGGGGVGGIEPRRFQRHRHDDAVLLALSQHRQRSSGKCGGECDDR
ncbi:hypothetical protein ACVWXM_000365 [Bradyrhizobium sp. GM7.3]